MIIISKKRIILLSSIIFVILFTCSLSINVKDKNIVDTTQTVALPVTNKVVVIDARTWKTRRRCTK